MPFYEYKCENCEEEFEELVDVNAENPSECPACDNPKIKRLISSSTSFKLKGAGWRGWQRLPVKRNNR